MTSHLPCSYTFLTNSHCVFSTSVLKRQIFLFCDDVVFKQRGNIDFEMNIDCDGEFTYPDFSDQVVIQLYMFEHQSNAPRHGSASWGLGEARK